MPDTTLLSQSEVVYYSVETMETCLKPATDDEFEAFSPHVDPAHASFVERECRRIRIFLLVRTNWRVPGFGFGKTPYSRS